MQWEANLQPVLPQLPWKTIQFSPQTKFACVGLSEQPVQTSAPDTDEVALCCSNSPTFFFFFFIDLTGTDEGGALSQSAASSLGKTK